MSHSVFRMNGISSRMQAMRRCLITFNSRLILTFDSGVPLLPPAATLLIDGGSITKKWNILIISKARGYVRGRAGLRLTGQTRTEWQHRGCRGITQLATCLFDSLSMASTLWETVDDFSAVRNTPRVLPKRAIERVRRST